MTDMNQPRPGDPQDAQLDRNLQALARHLELPQEPSPLQQARWRQVAAAEKGILGMKRKNFWKVLGAGSALAACITIVTVLAGGTQRVNAAQIFAELRESIRKSLWIELEDVTKDGMTANGRMLIVFSDAVVEDGASPTAADGVDASFFDMRITAADDHPEMPGLDLEVALGMLPESEWAFLQAHHLPGQLFADVPMLALFAAPLNNGVLLDLENFGGTGGLNLNTSSGGGANAKIVFRTGGDDNDEPEPNADASEAEGEIETEYSFNFSTVPSETEGSSAVSVSVANEVIHESMFGSDFRADADSPEAQAALDEHIAMVENFLSGRFSQEDMETFIDMIEASAETTTVTPLNNGAYLLTASGFNFDGHLEADVDMSLEVEYRAGGGIDRIELINIGDGPGRMRLEFSDDDANHAVFDRTPYANRPGVRSIGHLGDLFGSSGE